MDRQRHKNPLLPSGAPPERFGHEGGGIFAKAAEGGAVSTPSVPKGPLNPGTAPALLSLSSGEAPSPEEGGQGHPPDADLAPAGVPVAASAAEPARDGLPFSATSQGRRQHSGRPSWCGQAR